MRQSTPEFQVKLTRALSSYRAFAVSADFLSARLVHYVGVGKPNGLNVELTEIENEISNCLAEGLYVDWIENANQLFILVQEPDCPVPPWEKVFAEEALVDEAALLRKAGFR